MKGVYEHKKEKTNQLLFSNFLFFCEALTDSGGRPVCGKLPEAKAGPGPLLFGLLFAKNKFGQAPFSIEKKPYQPVWLEDNTR